MAKDPMWVRAIAAMAAPGASVLPAVPIRTANGGRAGVW